MFHCFFSNFTIHILLKYFCYLCRLRAYLTLMDGSTTLPSSLNSLVDCTHEAQSITGYKAPSAKCIDMKLILTYTSVDG